VVSPAPPAYAWDWLARQRVVWLEIRRRLIVDADRAPGGARSSGRSATDVPDWAADHPDLTSAPPGPPGPDEPTQEHARTDYRQLGTRAEVVAALRADYPADAAVRSTVDEVVGDVAFLGRLDTSLARLGVRTAPRGMRWWWSHLTGQDAPAVPSDAEESSEHTPSVPLQLRLVDVLAGYGDVTGS
jgi:hypothetical protein